MGPSVVNQSSFCVTSVLCGVKLLITKKNTFLASFFLDNGCILADLKMILKISSLRSFANQFIL